MLPGAAQAETRTLTVYHIHTKENITVTFKRNGRYDEAGLAKLNRFLRDWRNDAEIKMDPRLFDVVWEIYQDVGATEPIQIISAYRSPATNAMLRRRSRGVARFSQHMLGRAMDFNIRGISLEQVRNAGLRQQRGGVGFYPSSGAPFVHVDVGSVRHWPRLPPAALARVMNERPTASLAERGRAILASRNTEADETPVQAAPRSRGWFSRMFTRDNDEADQRAARTPDRQETSRPTRTAAVPLPPVRPGTRVSNSAMATASGRPSPAQVVQARGLWNATDAIAATDAAPPSAPKGPRLVWQVGPQPVAGLTDASAMTKRAPSPRTRPGFELAAAGPETTASLPPWPGEEREDRVPSELVLAYAASDPPEQSPRSAAPAPMGALRAPAAVPAKQLARPSAAARRTPPANRLGDNPWLRGVVMTPSVHDAMDVTVLGPLNFSALRPLMHKPATAIANAFAEEADFGLTSAAFSGSAIGVVPTVALGRVRASLN